MYLQKKYTHYIHSSQIFALKSLSENSIKYEDNLNENHDVDYQENCVYQNMISRNAEEMMLKIDFKMAVE